MERILVIRSRDQDVPGSLAFREEHDLGKSRRVIQKSIMNFKAEILKSGQKSFGD